MRSIFVNIKQLTGITPAGTLRLQGDEMSRSGSIEDAWLTVEEGRISGFGEMKDRPAGDFDETVDAEGCLMMPSFCDSHSHIVYAGTREEEESSTPPTFCTPPVRTASTSRALQG